MHIYIYLHLITSYFCIKTSYCTYLKHQYSFCMPIWEMQTTFISYVRSYGFPSNLGQNRDVGFCSVSFECTLPVSTNNHSNKIEAHNLKKKFIFKWVTLLPRHQQKKLFMK